MLHPYHPAIVVASLATVLGVVGCATEAQPPARQEPGLKQALSEVGGTYTWRADLDRYQYSDKLRLEEILSAQRREELVPVLVECLDDTSPSQSAIDGSPVAVGILCYEALTQLVYYEPTAPNGDIAASWSGNISPRASSQEMREAKDAWTKVVEAKAFIFQ